MNKVSALDYAFSVGRVRAMENFLIKKEVFDEAINSGLDDALKLFAETGLYNTDLVHTKDSERLEEILNEELSNLKEMVRRLILDKDLHSLMDITNLEEARIACTRFHSEFLNDYLAHLVDMHNIKTFLRHYILKEPPEEMERRLTREGFIPKKDFLHLYSQDLAAFLNRLEYVHKHVETIDYTYHLGEAIRKAAQDRSFIQLEKAIGDFLIHILKNAKYVTFGPEPVLAYYFAKRNEIGLIRMIILAKLNGVAGEVVKDRMNEVYA